jgi:hypothetical protein
MIDPKFVLLLTKYKDEDSCLVESDGTDRSVSVKVEKLQKRFSKSDDESAEGVLGTSRGASVRPRTIEINLIDSPPRPAGAPRASLNLGTSQDPICID